MNYTLDEEEEQILQLLVNVTAEKTFDKVYAHAWTCGDINERINTTFYHRDVRCEIKFNNEGCFTFESSTSACDLGNISLQRKYCFIKSSLFSLIRKPELDTKHPIIDASLNLHNAIMQREAEKNKLKQQKTWDKLFSKP